MKTVYCYQIDSKRKIEDTDLNILENTYNNVDGNAKIEVKKPELSSES